MRDRFRKFVEKQYGHPSGWFGRYIGYGMAKDDAYDAKWTVSLLGIQPASRVLEIGFGPGVAIHMASEQADQGLVAGIDHSATMVSVARKRNAAAIRAGRVELRQGEVSSLPYPDETFDIAFSLHSIYFWPERVSCLKELKRVLKPGGRLGITILPKDKWEDEITESGIMTLYFGSDLVPMFASAGYREVRVEISPPEDKVFLECVLGVK